MSEITPERVLEFRKKLRNEMFGDKCELWYYKQKEKSKDILLKNHPECPYKMSKGGTVPEHRYIWWLNHKDDPIKYNEEIHHINGDHQDNRIENLEKVTLKQHRQRHKELRKLNKTN